MSIEDVPADLRVPLGPRRVRLHERFDRLYESGAMTRTQAYRWLASVMGLTLEEAHIGLFTAEQISQAHYHLSVLEAKAS